MFWVWVPSSVSRFWSVRKQFLSGGSFGGGRHAFAVPVPWTAGPYTVQRDATDLAGNYAQQSLGSRVRSGR